VFLLSLADFLGTGQGMVIALILQGASLLPFVGNRARGMQPKLYATLAILGVLGLALVWLGLLRPVVQFQALLIGR